MPFQKNTSASAFKHQMVYVFFFHGPLPIHEERKSLKSAIFHSKGIQARKREREGFHQSQNVPFEAFLI